MENGLTYSQFLEAILRIAYYKKNESDQAGNVDGFKNTLEAIFAETELDLKKRQKSDPVLEKVVQLSNNGYWSSKYFLLAGIFEAKGTLKADNLELAKQDFIALFNEAKITMKPAKAVEETKGGKGDKGKEPPKGKEEEKVEAAPKFDEQDIADAIKMSQSFDDDQLSYIDFLEAIVRVTEVYPFSDMQKADVGVLNYEKKVDILIDKLGCFSNLEETFIQHDKNRT